MTVLYESKNDQLYRVVVAPEVPLLNTLGIYVDSIITKKATYRLGGPVLVKVDNREVAIGKELAKQIQVEEVK